MNLETQEAQNMSNTHKNKDNCSKEYHHKVAQK